MDEYIIYNTTYHILICRQCGYAIPQDGIMRHYRRFHKTIPLVMRQEIIKYGLSLDLHQPNHYSTPGSRRHPKIFCADFRVRFPSTFFWTVSVCAIHTQKHEHDVSIQTQKRLRMRIMSGYYNLVMS